jgi:Kelch motif
MPRSASATATCWVIGGDGALASTEVWAHGRFRPGPPLLHGRKGHTATLLKDGRVLVVGGYDAEGRAIRATELLRGQTPVRAPKPGSDPLHTARGKHAAVALPDGRVLVIGGSRDAETRERLASTELFDPRTGRFAPGPDLRSARYKLPAAAALLPDGRVLVAGDSAAPEIVDLRRGRSVAVPGGGVAGSFATATALEAGTTLIAGGYDDRIAISGAAFVAGRSR